MKWEAVGLEPGGTWQLPYPAALPLLVVRAPDLAQQDSCLGSHTLRGNRDRQEKRKRSLPSPLPPPHTFPRLGSIPMGLIVRKGTGIVG